MYGYLGTPGAMVTLPYRGGLDTSSDRPVSFTRTLGGKRKAFQGARSRREWGVSVDLTGSLLASGLAALANGAGEAMWYPADAVAGNMLSPQASGFETAPVDATDAGFVSLPDGSVARSVVSSAAVRPGDAHGTFEMVPLRSGEAVSVGAWSVGGQHFRGFWRDASGSSITNWSVPATTHAGWAWREAVLTPPAGAAFIELHLAGGSQYARPSVSWGSEAKNRPGRGAPKVVVHGLSEALTVIARDDAYGSIDVTITEVG